MVFQNVMKIFNLTNILQTESGFLHWRQACSNYIDLFGPTKIKKNGFGTGLGLVGLDMNRAGLTCG